MTAKSSTILATAALALLVGAPGASAALRIVSATNQFPAQYTTIQSAVNASSSGDYIIVLAGEYRENVTIPIGKPSLTISGVLTNNLCLNQASVIVDGSPNGVDATSFTVDADHTTIQCLTIRHGNQGIHAFASQLIVSKVRILHTNSDGIDVDGDGFVLTDVSVTSSGDIGIYAEGNNGRIATSQVLLSDDACFEVYGDNNRIEGDSARLCEDSYAFYVEGNTNSLTGLTGEATDDTGIYISGNDNVLMSSRMFNTDGGIYVEGDRNTVSGNTVEQPTYNTGIYVDGASPIVTGNTVKSVGDDTCYTVYGNAMRVEGNTANECSDGGFYLDGNNPIVKANTADRVGESPGIEVSCETCNLGRIEGNTATGTNNDEPGFYIYAGGEVQGGFGLTVISNRASYNISDGFYLDMDQGTITSNNATYNGAERESGIRLNGSDNMVLSNSGSANGDNGLEIDGSRNTLRFNMMTSNFDDGIEISFGTGNIVDRNTTFLNQGEGIENGGEATVLTSNTSRSNRRPGDCVNDGTIATNTGNICADGSNFAIPGQID